MVLIIRVLEVVKCKIDHVHFFAWSLIGDFQVHEIGDLELDILTAKPVSKPE